MCSLAIECVLLRESVVYWYSFSNPRTKCTYVLNVFHTCVLNVFYTCVLNVFGICVECVLHLCVECVYEIYMV